MPQDDMQREAREHAWHYFQLHAGQRMSIFNFFVVMSTLFTTALATTFTEEFNYPHIGMIFGVDLVVTSFLFWKLDQRVRFLIKVAETALTTIESHWGKQKDTSISPLTLFSAEKAETERKRAESSWWRPRSWHLKYSECFAAAYVVFAAIGITGFIAASLR